MGLAARLGNADVRARRHRRAAALGILLLLVAGGLLFLGREDDDDGGVADTCTEFSERIQNEYALTFPEGAPLSEAAAAQYLSHAFADTMDDFVVALQAQEPSGEVGAIVDDLATRVDEVRATPEDFLQASPLAEIDQRFDDAGLAPCGSEFFAPSE